jgi:hypothetical protein
VNRWGTTRLLEASTRTERVQPEKVTKLESRPVESAGKEATERNSYLRENNPVSELNFTRKDKAVHLDAAGSKSLLIRMSANAVLETLLDAIPIFGGLFDLAFKSDRRNLLLLERLDFPDNFNFFGFISAIGKPA